MGPGRSRSMGARGCTARMDSRRLQVAPLRPPGILATMEGKPGSSGGTGARLCVALLALALGSSGCNTIRQMTPAARQAAEVKEQMDQLQARSMRFADEYVGRVVEDSSRFIRAQDDPQIRLALASWQLTQANAAYGNASGPSPVVNALDLVTLASLSRMVIEDTIVTRFPETGQQLLATHRELEKTAWTLCDEFLTPSQIADFHGILDEWRRQHPTVRTVAFIHFLDFAKQIGRPKPGEEARTGRIVRDARHRPARGPGSGHPRDRADARARRADDLLHAAPAVRAQPAARARDQRAAHSSRVSADTERLQQDQHVRRAVFARRLGTARADLRGARGHGQPDRGSARGAGADAAPAAGRSARHARGGQHDRAITGCGGAFVRCAHGSLSREAAGGRRRAWEVVPTVRHHRVHRSRRGIQRARPTSCSDSSLRSMRSRRPSRRRSRLRSTAASR